MKDAELLGDVAWFTQRMPEGPSQVQGARRPDLEGDIAKNGDGYGRNSCGLNRALDQSDGPIADPSSGSEEHKVRRVGAQQLEQGWKDLLLERSHVSAVDMAHEGVVLSGQTAEASVCHELPNPVEGKHDVVVAVGIAMIVVIVGDDELLRSSGGGNHSVRGISVRVGHVEWSIWL